MAAILSRYQCVNGSLNPMRKICNFLCINMWANFKNFVFVFSVIIDLFKLPCIWENKHEFYKIIETLRILKAYWEVFYGLATQFCRIIFLSNVKTVTGLKELQRKSTHREQEWSYRKISNTSRHQIPKLKCFLSRLANVFAQSIEVGC